MTEERFSLRVRIGDCEIEIGGKKDQVMATLDELPEVVQKVSRTFEGTRKGIVQPPVVRREVEKTDVTETPETIPAIPKPAGPSDAIIKLLSTEWGRKPRVWQEINEALTTNAIYYSKGSITGTLTNLTKKGRLRRIRTEKGYGYILS